MQEIRAAHDDLDARIAWLLGSMWLRDCRVNVLGNLKTGAFLLPEMNGLQAAFSDSLANTAGHKAAESIGEEGLNVVARLFRCIATRQGNARLVVAMVRRAYGHQALDRSASASYENSTIEPSLLCGT
jgi:hypothetical protein